MGNPTQLFLWTNTGNYPAGSNPWNGQPLAVAPVGTYFTPGVKLPAENENYILGEIQADIAQLYANGTISVASLTAFRALPVPSFNASVVCTPENTGQQLEPGFAGGSFAPYIGGEYYYDSAYNVVDNGCTAIKPNAIAGGSPGRWRLKGNTLFTVFEQYADTLQFSGATYFTSLTANGSAQFKTSGASPFLLSLATGAGSSNIYLNDIIDVRASVVTAIPSGSSGGNISSYFARNGSQIGTSVSTVGAWTSAITYQQELVLQYVVTAADITSGTLNLSAYSSLSSASGSPSFTSTITNYKFTIRRP